MRILSLAVLAVCLTTVSAFGEDTLTTSSTGIENRHEVVLGTAPVNFGSKTTGAELYTDFSHVIVGISGNYNYALNNCFQLGTDVTFGLADSSGSSTTIVSLQAGPTLNIPFSSDWLYNSVFITAMGGVQIVDTSAASASTDAIISGEVGYRFRIVDHVTWHPAIGTRKILNGSKFEFAIRPVSFSIIF